MGDDETMAKKAPANGDSDSDSFSIQRDADAIMRDAAERAATRVRITEGQRKTLGTRRRRGSRAALSGLAAP